MITNATLFQSLVLLETHLPRVAQTPGPSLHPQCLSHKCSDAEIKPVGLGHTVDSNSTAASKGRMEKVQALEPDLGGCVTLCGPPKL